ncbi:MAG: hypothetical protein IGS39_16975 [Calothrix sp. C42_A2020_038]|nr:hypothetical protein [Calothrix sp. C42_A2020_038]
MNDKSAISAAIGAPNGSSKTRLQRYGEGSNLPFSLLYGSGKRFKDANELLDIHQHILKSG